MERRYFIRTILGLTAMGTLSSLQKLSDNLITQEQIMPVLFIGHGSPMNAIEDNEFSQRWREMGLRIPKPEAVLCISAHWLTKGTLVTAMNHPRTIHDFGGFPKELFETQYAAPGSPKIAEETQKLISSTKVELDHDWGLDHGTWSVVKQMYPDADIPVLQLSIDYHKPLQFHYELSKELATLRKKGVLIIGSGNMVHNLRKIGFPKDMQVNSMNTEYGYDWALEMNDIFKKYIIDRNHKALIDYKNLSRSAELAIPTPDHYIPLLYTLGLQGKNEEPNIFNDKAVGGSITMTSVRFG